MAFDEIDREQLLPAQQWLLENVLAPGRLSRQAGASPLSGCGPVSSST
ncbi:hypothetical protein [Streptomyces sp. NPDC015680]